jgi:hypothetical protein
VSNVRVQRFGVQGSEAPVFALTSYAAARRIQGSEVVLIIEDQMEEGAWGIEPGEGFSFWLSARLLVMKPPV